MTDNHETQSVSTWPDVLLFAYTPSGKREGFTYTLVYGLLAVLISAGLLVGLELLITAYIPSLSEDSFPNLLVALSAGLIPGVVLGALTGVAVGKGALRDKNRNPRLAQLIAGSAGALVVVAYIVVRIVLYQAAAFDSSLALSGMIMFALPVILLAAARGDRTIVNMPFCEECATWMEQFTFELIPAPDPATTMPLLAARDFAALAGMAEDALEPAVAHIDMQVWYCPNCHASGYLNVIRTPGRKKRGSMGNIINFPPEPRQILSERLTADEVTRALSAQSPAAKL